MRNWLVDPITRATMRRSLSWVRLAPVVPVFFIESSQPSTGRPLRIAAYALCCVAPQAAAGFLEAEHDGRLNQMRLSGQTTPAIARYLFAASGIWLIVAAAALLWALSSGGWTMQELLIITTMTAVTVAGGAIACTAKTVRDQIDPRISTAGLVAAGLTIGVSTGGLLQVGLPALYLAPALLALVVIIVERARHFPARVRYPGVGSQSRAGAFRIVRHEWLLRWPALYRGLCLSSSGFVTAALFAPALIPLAIFGGRQQYEGAIFVAVLPLIIGVVAVSLICREDAISGRMDLVRQSSRPSARSAVEFIVGLWTPFIVAAAVIAGLASLMAIPYLDDILFTVMMFAVVLPLPALEGWSRLWPILTTLPFLMAFAMARGFGFGVQQVIVALLGWIAAARRFENPERPILPDWAAVATAGALSVAPFVPVVTLDAPAVTTLVCGLMFLTSQVLIDPRHHRIARWGQLLAAGAIMLIGVGVGSGLLLGAWSAVVTLTALFCAYRIRQITPDRPTIQAVIRIGAIMALVEIDSASRFGRDSSSINLQDPATMLGVVVAAAVLSEIGYRISLYRSRPIAAATLPA